MLFDLIKLQTKGSDIVLRYALVRMFLLLDVFLNFFVRVFHIYEFVCSFILLKGSEHLEN